MPRYSKYRKKYTKSNRKYRKKTYGKKKSYIARLKDKKINTLAEHRSKQIALQVQQKAVQYYATRGVWLGGQAIWPINDTYPAIQDSMTILNSQFWYREFAKVGGYLDTDISNQMITAGSEPRNMIIHLKSFKIHFDFIVQGQEKAIVDMCIWRFPYNKYLLASDTTPDATKNPQPQYFDHKPFTPYNTIDSFTVKEFHDAPNVTGFNKQLVASKRITVHPSSNLIDVQTQEVNRIHWTPLKITKTYKGLGYAEPFEIQQQLSPVTTYGSLSNNRYYISIRVTNTVQVRGISFVKFAKGRNIPDEIIFDRIAPNSG